MQCFGVAIGELPRNRRAQPLIVETMFEVTVALMMRNDDGTQ